MTLNNEQLRVSPCPTPRSCTWWSVGRRQLVHCDCVVVSIGCKACCGCEVGEGVGAHYLESYCMVKSQTAGVRLVRELVLII